MNGLVLQVRTYCAQYNIRKTTTNSSTIGALRINSTTGQRNMEKRALLNDGGEEVENW